MTLQPAAEGAAGSWFRRRVGWRQLFQAIAVALLVAFWLNKGLLHPHLTSDGSAYWGVRDGVLYEGVWLQEQAGLPNPYVYSPAFAQLIFPITQLPLAAFMAAWVAIQLGAVTFLAGPILAAATVWLWPPLGDNNIWAGQIYPLMALALGLAPRWPAAWSFLLLTKVTPGIGLVWHVARREWRAFGVALGATALIAGTSALLFGFDHWLAWADVLRDAAGRNSPFEIPVPLPIRAVLAAVLIAVGARRDWLWTLPVGVILALPHGLLGATPLLLAVIYWWRIGRAGTWGR